MVYASGVWMKNYFSLVKLLLVQQYRTRPIGKKSNRTGTIVALVVLGICFLPMLAGIAVFSYFLGQTVGADLSILTLLLTTCQGLVLIFGTPSLLTNVFNGKDADRLLFLPVKTTTLFAAKLTVVYLNEFVTTAATALLMLLLYGIGAEASALFYFSMPFALLLIPILPLMVGCIFCVPISVILAKIGKNGIVRTIFQVLFFAVLVGGYFVLFGGLQSGDDSGLDSLQDVIWTLAERFRNAGQKLNLVHSNAMMSAMLVANSFGDWLVSSLLTLVENLALLVVVMLIAWPTYRRILSSSLESGGISRHRESAKDLKTTQNGVVKELIFSDLKRTARNNQLGFQAFAGLVLMPLMIVFFYFALSSGIEDGVSFVDLMQDNLLYQTITPLVVVAYMTMLGISSNVLGLYPISRENNSLFLLKSLPVDFNKILLSKVILATVVMAVVDFLTILFSVLLFGLYWYSGVLMFLTMLLLGFGGMCATTLIDLKSPKLGWTNFNQSLKNAKNSWLAMLIGLLIFVGIAGVAAGFVVWFATTAMPLALILMWTLIIAVSAAFAAVSYKIMAGKSADYFGKIEV